VYYSDSLHLADYQPVVWKLKIPPRIQVFLWPFSQNKIMTKDNLRKRGKPKPLECILCKEIEYVTHLFFDCIVSQLLLKDVYTIFDVMMTDIFLL
jgi:hypothetical protein